MGSLGNVSLEHAAGGDIALSLGVAVQTDHGDLYVGFLAGGDGAQNSVVTHAKHEVDVLCAASGQGILEGVVGDFTVAGEGGDLIHLHLGSILGHIVDKALSAVAAGFYLLIGDDDAVAGAIGENVLQAVLGCHAAALVVVGVDGGNDLAAIGGYVKAEERDIRMIGQLNDGAGAIGVAPCHGDGVNAGGDEVLHGGHLYGRVAGAVNELQGHAQLSGLLLHTGLDAVEENMLQVVDNNADNDVAVVTVRLVRLALVAACQ